MRVYESCIYMRVAYIYESWGGEREKEMTRFSGYFSSFSNYSPLVTLTTLK